MYCKDRGDIVPKTVTIRVQGIFVDGQVGPDGDDGMYVDRFNARSLDVNDSVDPYRDLYSG